MKNIRKQEEAVLAVFQTMTLTKDGKAHRVPAMYASREKLESFMMLTTKADGVIELKNDPLRLPVVGICATAIGRNEIKFKGWIFSNNRQELNDIIQQMYCLEVEDCMSNNVLTIHRAKIKDKEIGSPTVGSPPVRVLAAKFTATLNM